VAARNKELADARCAPEAGRDGVGMGSRRRHAALDRALGTVRAQAAERVPIEVGPAKEERAAQEQGSIFKD